MTDGITNSLETQEGKAKRVPTPKQFTRRSIIKRDRTLIAETKAQLETVTGESEIDHLTQIPNRKGFERRLAEEAERIKRSQGQATLLSLDANNLKIINDINQNHAAGDQLLTGIAEALKSSTRKIDAIGRVGGDEFAMLLVGLNAEQTEILWKTRLEPMFQERGISIAVGASEFDPNDAKESMARADLAMYKAKDITKEGLEPKEMATKSALVFYRDTQRAA